MDWRKLIAGLELKKNWHIYLFGALVCWYCIDTLRSLLPYCSDSNMINDDLRQHLLPFYAKMYPENFSDMFLVNYSRMYLPAAYYAIFRTVTLMGIDPVIFSKLLGVALVLIVWLLSFLVGKKIGGLVCGFFALLLAAHGEWIVEQTFAGLFRSFSYPLLFAFIYFWLMKKTWAVCLVIFLTTLLYPPIFFICCGAFAIEFLVHPLKSLKQRRKELLIYCATAIISLGSVLIFSQKPEEYGKPVTLAEASKMGEWSKHGGRFRDLPLKTPKYELFNSARLGLHSGWHGKYLCKGLTDWNQEKKDVYFIICFWLLLIPLFFLKPFPFWYFGMMFFSLAMYFAARLKAFTMGWPDRYLTYCLPALIILMFPIAWKAVDRFKPACKYVSRSLIGMLLAGCFIVYPFGMDGLEGDVITVEHQRPLLDALKEHEEPMLIAAWPCPWRPVDNIALYSHKEVVVDYEHAHPIYKDYYAEARKRIIDVLFLIFAISEKDAGTIRDKYGLTHVIIEPRYYDLQKRRPRIFMPFDGLVDKLRYPPPGVKVDYIFSDIPKDRLVYEDQYFQVVDLTKY